MGTSRYSLGDGISSVSNRHMGYGVILNTIHPSGYARVTATHNNISLSESTTPGIGYGIGIDDEDPETFSPFKKKYPIKELNAKRLNIGSTDFTLHLVKNHEDLKKILSIDANINSGVSFAGNISANLAFAKSVTLNRENVTLIVIGERIAHEDIIPKSKHLKFDTKLNNLLDTDPITFKNSNGDHYIFSIQYGEKILAEIQILRVSNEKGEEFKQSFSAKLRGLLKNDLFNTSTKTHYTNSELFERSEIDIRLTHIGTPEIGFPPPSMNIETFAKFLEKFNNQVETNAKNKHADYPVGYTTKPYANLLKSYSASHLFNNVEITKELLSQFEQLLNRIHLIMPTAKKIVDQTNKYPKTQQNEQQINRLITLYNDATTYQDDIQMLMPIIEFAQTDIAKLRWRLPSTLNNFSRSPVPTAGSQTPNVENNDDEKLSFNARVKLLEKAKNFKDNIEKLERDIASAVASLEAEIQTIQFTEKNFSHRLFGINALKMNRFVSHRFHIKTPAPNVTLRWRILASESRAPLNNVQFNVYMQKYVLFRKFRPFTDLRHNAITEVAGMHSAYRYKIKDIRTLTGEPYRQPLTIMISICCELALQVRNGNNALEQLPSESPEHRVAISDEHRSIYIDSQRSQQHSFLPLSQMPGLYRPETLPTVRTQETHFTVTTDYAIKTSDGAIKEETATATPTPRSILVSRHASVPSISVEENKYENSPAKQRRPSETTESNTNVQEGKTLEKQHTLPSTVATTEVTIKTTEEPVKENKTEPNTPSLSTSRHELVSNDSTDCSTDRDTPESSGFSSRSSISRRSR